MLLEIHAEKAIKILGAFKDLGRVLEAAYCKRGGKSIEPMLLGPLLSALEVEGEARAASPQSFAHALIAINLAHCIKPVFMVPAVDDIIDMVMLCDLLEISAPFLEFLIRVDVGV
jgi:hypothetical protein